MRLKGERRRHFILMIPGHQVVGVVKESGDGVTSVKVGDRVGVAWIYTACGNCELCEKGFENLCDRFTATGRDVNGGYAEQMTAPAEYVYLIPEKSEG
jgi:alcohol dehydrogenase, propanol-preferring